MPPRSSRRRSDPQGPRDHEAPGIDHRSSQGLLAAQRYRPQTAQRASSRTSIPQTIALVMTQLIRSRRRRFFRNWRRNCRRKWRCGSPPWRRSRRRSSRRVESTLEHHFGGDYRARPVGLRRRQSDRRNPQPDRHHRRKEHPPVARGGRRRSGRRSQEYDVRVRRSDPARRPLGPASSQGSGDEGSVDRAQGGERRGQEQDLRQRLRARRRS